MNYIQTAMKARFFPVAVVTALVLLATWIVTGPWPVVPQHPFLNLLVLAPFDDVRRDPIRSKTAPLRSARTPAILFYLVLLSPIPYRSRSGMRRPGFIYGRSWRSRVKRVAETSVLKTARHSKIYRCAPVCPLRLNLRILLVLLPPKISNLRPINTRSKSDSLLRHQVA